MNDIQERAQVKGLAGNFVANFHIVLHRARQQKTGSECQGRHSEPVAVGLEARFRAGIQSGGAEPPAGVESGPRPLYAKNFTWNCVKRRLE